jgi:hypothetical protein
MTHHQQAKPLRKHMNERRILKENIRDYLSRVEIIEDSIVLSLLHRARDALKDVKKQDASILSSMFLELHQKLEFIQTSLHRLKKKIIVEIKFASYATAMLKLSRSLFETNNEIAQSFETRKITITSQFQLSHRNVIIFIINESEKQKLKKMSNENLLIVMQKIVKKMRNVTRFRSDDIRIQIESIAIKTTLQTDHD